MGESRSTAMPLFIGTVLFCLSANSYAGQGPPTASGQQIHLLRQLQQEWQEQRSAELRATSDFLRLELTPLVGVTRARVASQLGRPDFCLPNPDSCGHSPRWVYFFYRYQPPSARQTARGMTEVKVTAGGGWALEMGFSNHGAIEKASWVKQE
jgi:hypothetical protein